MNEKIDPIDAADALTSGLRYMRILLRAAEDKVQFYLTNKSLLGPGGELLSLQARELDDLLFLTGRFLDKMEGDMETAADLLYGIKSSVA